MPAVDPQKLKRLMTQEALLPFALKRNLSGAQLDDLVKRAMKEARFDLSAVSDDFAGHMDADEAADWATEFERAGTAPHLFTSEAADKVGAEEMYGGVKMSDFLKLSPERRLAIANKVADEKRNAKKQ